MVKLKKYPIAWKNDFHYSFTDTKKNEKARFRYGAPHPGLRGALQVGIKMPTQLHKNENDSILLDD